MRYSIRTPAVPNPGTRLGVYEVGALIGSGGMGEVYRARDTRLQRDVALKILPDAFAADPDRLARFEREARTLAVLNHPHIAQIHGFEHADGIHALVMELVEGEDLSQRTGRGRIPLDEALPIAGQIADALEAAHAAGVVHRDLKPANIKVRPDGTVKVLDFGLAKAFDARATEAGSASVSLSPTLTAATGVGVILGTAAYMSPEQARGKHVDKRADIWAFGCVLFEMLTGKRAFDGDDVTDVLAFIITKEPDWGALSPGTPAPLQKLLRRCLEKDRKRRLADIADARFELEEAAHPPAATVAAPVSVARSRVFVWLPWLVSAAALVTLVLVGWRWYSAPLSAPVRVVSDIGADASLVIDQGAAFALSPNGQLLAFVAQAAGAPAQLFVRRLDQLSATPLAGTVDARNPFFSPDGQWIGFFADGKLKKISVSGGAAVTLCDAPRGRGGSWSSDGTIVFTPESTGRTALRRVSDTGGVSQQIGEAVDSELVQRYPQVLPGGRAVLYAVNVTAGNNETARVVVQPLPEGPRRVLREGAYYPRYAASGHLLFVHEGTLFAQAFDVERLELAGEPIPILEGIATSGLIGGAQIAVSESGTFAYLPGNRVQGVGGSAPILWLDRVGGTTPLRPQPSEWSNPRFSPDGRRLALDINVNGNIDVWTYDWERDALELLTRDPRVDRRPVWTPDGSRIVFASTAGGAGTAMMYWRRADGTGEPTRLLDTDLASEPSSWHPNGKVLAFTQYGRDTFEDLMTVTVEGDERTGWDVGTPQVFLKTPVREMEPMFSPDGRWIAYYSQESGRNEVYVRSFPDGGNRVLVSTAGGVDPAWSRASQELFYWSGLGLTGTAQGGELYAASYRVDQGTLLFDRPRAIPNARIGPRPRQRDFDVHPDGKRFAVGPVAPAPPATAQRSVVLVFNFFEELKRMAPRGRR
jgi:Tol biopolymer transport system component